MKTNSMLLRASMLFLVPILVANTAGERDRSYFSMEFGDEFLIPSPWDIEKNNPERIDPEESEQLDERVDEDVVEDDSMEKDDGLYLSVDKESDCEGTSGSKRGRFFFPVQFSAEIRGQLLSTSWHTKSSASSAHLGKLTSGLSNTSAFVYQDGNDSSVNKSFGGRVMAKTSFYENFFLMLGLGYETGMPAATGYKPLGAGEPLLPNTFTLAEWDTLDSLGSRWKNDNLYVPAVFIGYQSLSLGAEYDMRKYAISGHEASVANHLKSNVNDYQVLFGFRGEQALALGSMNFIISYEYMTNLGEKSDVEMKAYQLTLAEYGLDCEIKEDGGGIFVAGLLNVGSGTAAPSARAVVSSTYTNLSKASIGIGMSLFNL